MGTNKALLDFQGEKLIERIARQFRAWFDQVVIVTNAPADYAFLDLATVGDRIPGLGPLGGIEAGLAASRHRRAFFAACDMPFLSRELIGHLLDLAAAADVVVPVVNGDYEPMHAVYTRACLPAIRASLDAGRYKIIHFYDQVRVRRVTEAELAPFGPSGKLFFNCNTPADLDRARALAENTPGPGR